MKSAHSKVVVALVATVVLGMATIAVSQYSIQTNRNLLRGNWTFSAHPYQGADLQVRPVFISSVETTLDIGALTMVAIRNQSSQPVKAVKFKWGLFSEQNPDITLNEGTTDWKELPKNIPAGERLRLKFLKPFVSLASASGGLVRNGVLNGDFYLTVEVSEVKYEDGSSWLAKHGIGGALLLNASYKVSTQSGCAKQKCKNLGGSGYSCETSSDSEFCTNKSSSCCVTLCGEPACGGSGGDDPPPIETE